MHELSLQRYLKVTKAYPERKKFVTHYKFSNLQMSRNPKAEKQMVMASIKIDVI